MKGKLFLTMNTAAFIKRSLGIAICFLAPLLLKSQSYRNLHCNAVHDTAYYSFSFPTFWNGANDVFDIEIDTTLNTVVIIKNREEFDKKMKNNMSAAIRQVYTNYAVDSFQIIQKLGDDSFLIKSTKRIVLSMRTDVQDYFVLAAAKFIFIHKLVPGMIEGERIAIPKPFFILTAKAK